MSISVRPVTTNAELQAFLRMPWKVYKDNPNWTAPLWKEHIHFFDPAHNPELKHIDHQKFVAWRGDEPVGTVIAHINHAYNDYQGENAGWFGQFELINDAEVGAALLSTAEDWVQAKGVHKIMGPGTYSTNSEVGLLVEGHESPTMILMPYHQPYYQGFIEECGYSKAIDLWAWYVNAEKVGGRNAESIPERLTRVVQKLRDRKNFTTRLVNMREFDAEIEKVKKLYNAAWSKNWGFIPLNDAEIDHLAAGLKAMVDPNIVVWVERDGQSIGVAIPLPNINQPMRAAKFKPGEPEWWQLLKLIWHWKVASKPTGVRVWAMGILEEYRGSGVDAILYYEMLKRGLPRGYRDIEMSWILENNDMMNRGIEGFGGEVYKVYRVYEKAF